MAAADIHALPAPRAPLHELAVVACCVHADRDGASRAAVLSRVSDGDLQDVRCKLALRAVRELASAGEFVSADSVLLYLERHGMQVADAAFVYDLRNDLPDPWAVDQYVGAVKDAALCRHLLEGARRVAELAAAGNPEALAETKAALDRAHEIIEVRGQTTLRENLGAVSDELDRPVGSASGIASGLPALDRITCGWRPGQMIVVAGRTGMGKSALALGFAREAALRGRQSVAYVSLEMSAGELSRRLIAAETGISHDRIRGNLLDANERERVREWTRNNGGWDLFIDASARMTIDDLQRKLWSLHHAYGLNLLVVDYLQLVTSTERGRSREQEVAQISRSCKSIARELNVPVIALSQLSRDCDKENRRPRLSDLRESGSLEQDSDLVLFIYREDVYSRTPGEHPAELIVAKQRDGDTGIVGCLFDGARMRFRPAAESAY